MKRLFLLVFIAAAASAFRVSAPATMTFDETKFNFGFIHQGDVVTHEFKFTNTGDEAIVITDAEVACKCTTVGYPKTPIPKGGTGTITVTFDSKSAIDRQVRTVTVTSNAANSPAVLTFKCVVLKPKSD